MIFVDRTVVQNPLQYPPLANKVAQEFEHARAEVVRGRGQRRFLFTVYKRPEVKAALNALFHDKCAYCETQLVSAVGDIEQFRPKEGVSEAKDHPGYWWLASEWQNLLIACQFCNRLSKAEIGEGGGSQSIGKHNRFPLVDERKRARSPGDDLFLEQPLLLDPTVDDPSRHLTFSDIGEVFSETERGNATISILGLNRRGLLEQRGQVAVRYRSLLESTIRTLTIGDAQAPKLMEELGDMTRSEAAYAGMVRQFLQRDRPRLENEARKFPAADLPTEHMVLRRPGEQSVAATPVRVKRALRSTKAYRRRMASYSLTNEEGIRKYKSERRAIEAISIRNIRAVGSFEVSPAALGIGAGRWLMLLGENGTGKSTILQAIALVLCGSDYVSKLIREERVVLDDLVRFRCRSGKVAVKLSGFDAPHRLEVFRDRLEFTSPTKEVVTIDSSGQVDGAAWAPQTVMAGYGATRLPPRHPEDAEAGGDFARVENLFDPFVPLNDPQAWLTGLIRKDFDRTAIVIKDLLSIDPGAVLGRRAGRITVKTSGTNVSLNSLSIGYQTIVAAIADILEILSRVWSNPLEAEGIVLIDELDAHLHPTWQMQIVHSLRRALPGVQFITTTHQPLCLRGLEEGEVVVMRRDENHQIEVITDLPSPADFRVDQLLTSSFFGLSSTIDPDTERLFDRYYALLALETLSAEEEAELTRLTAELEKRRQFGETQREGLYLEAIDRVLARQKAMPVIPQEEVREEAVSEISAIWDSLIADVAPADGDMA
jgi:uncharacterized protein (TIGR02646 family)